MNPLRRVAQFFSWLRRVSVWGPDAIPAREKDYQLLTRLVFPFVDLLIVAMGVLGAVFHVPALDKGFDAGLVDLISYTLAATGFICFIAISFPRLYLVEMVAKQVLIVALVLYPGIVLAAAMNGETGGFVAGLGMLAVVPFLIWRFCFLGVQMYKKHRLKAKIRKILTGCGGA